MSDNTIELELKEHSIEYVLGKYDLTFKELFDKQYEKHNIHQDASYIYNTKDKRYGIQKALNGKVIHYGVYNAKEIALSVVRELQEVNWDKNELPRILMDLGVWGN